MNRKGQAQILPVIVGIILLIIIASTLSDLWEENHCKDYISQIQTLKNNNEKIQRDKSQLESQISTCENKYQKLIKTNVTKKDIEDILNEIKQTQSEITYMKTEFTNINTNILQSYNTLVKNYRLSITITIAIAFWFVLDLTLLAFNIDLKKRIIEFIKKKRNN